VSEFVGFVYHPRVKPDLAALQAARGVLADAGLEHWEMLRHVRPASLASRLRRTRLLVTLGGDGTLLYGSRLAVARGIPLLGVNLGRLGFLTELEAGELQAGLRRFLAGDFRLEERTMLSATLWRNSSRVVGSLGLNEAVVHRAGLGLIRTLISVDAQEVGTIDADGVIVATATGSTAYALAAGGPILEPDIADLLVVPMSAFALTVRPIVTSPDDSLTVELIRGEAQLAVDGYLSRRLRVGDQVRVETYPKKLAMVRFSPPHRVYEMLREKLGWGLPLVPRER
jgi:NAD+ kinase